MNSSFRRPPLAASSSSSGTSPKPSTMEIDSKMKKVNLLPTKVSKNDMAVSRQNPKGWEGRPNSQSRWKAQPVMDWVESLAAATEAGERREGQRMGELSVGGISLSAPSTVLHTNSRAARSVPRQQQPQTALDSRHRQLPLAMPTFWDIGFLNQDAGSSRYVRQIASLAVEIESLPGQSVAAQLRADYKSAQTRLVCTFHSIMHHQSEYESEEEKRLALVALYETTITKLQHIIETAASGKPPRTKSSVQASQPNTRRTTSVAISPEKKKDLSDYMTKWLRKNWTNPYPDEQGLEEMARDCGTTATIVSNWLINARTRKWRPAIVKASEMNRPSYMLLEDSLCLFDGGTVQPLPDENGEGPASKRIKRSYSSNV